ncbi:hypothetical protein TeGR_g15014 [Tetraparma gracilis]|uniref:START domain-containing protein n=1 Tax=Tetraparma gracilis TaxID=2962635 RepID=A0ABQ6MPT5_9STRA|nr:hypothetical protein TeGR_g15014 [Tetraparma gracilis]
MRELFQRDEAIDDAKRSELADIIRSNNENYTDVENAVVDRVRDQLDSIPDSSFEKFESPDHLVHMEGFHKGGKNGIPRASTVLDEEICACAAWSYPLETRHEIKAFFADGGVESAVTVHNSHYVTGQQLRDFNIPTFSPREFVARSVWRWESETELLLVTESCLAEQYPIRPGIVRASVTTLRKFERLDPVGEIPQTRITWTQQPDMGGFIPSKAVRGAAVGQMMYVSTMRKRFDKSPAIDAASNLRLVTIIQNHDDDEYTEEEEEILTSGLKHFDNFREQKGKDVKMGSRLTTAKLAYEDGDRLAFGYATTMNVVRATYPSAYKIIDAGSGFTKLEYVIHPDSGGVIPAIVMRQIMGSNLEHVSHARRHLQSLRGLEDWDAKDGEAIGEVLVTKTDAEEHHGKGETKVEARVRETMEKQKGLKELGQKHEWFKVLLAKVVANKLRPAGDSKAKLCNMSVKEANVIGGALASCIAANLTAPAAVDEWILRYPAMGELEREYVWFRPMMDTIAQRLLESVSWGLKMRLYTGAGLSTLDLISDLYMIYTYATTGQQGAALSLAIMVGVCLLLQLIFVYMNTRRGPKLTMVKEMLIVLSGTA